VRDCQLDSNFCVVLTCEVGTRMYSVYIILGEKGGVEKDARLSEFLWRLADGIGIFHFTSGDGTATWECGPPLQCRKAQVTTQTLGVQICGEVIRCLWDPMICCFSILILL
jgi:hypothetical protein